MCLTFQMMALEKYVTTNFEIFLRGYPLFGPSKCGVSKNYHHSTAYDHIFLLQSPSLLRKCVCLQKTRAQSVKIWLTYKGFKSKKKHFRKFSFVRPANEKRRKSAGFQDFSEIFFLHGQLLPPYSIWGLTLILGSIKSPKKAKDSCGSRGPPPG